MEKGLKVIDTILAASIKLTLVFAIVIGAKGIYAAVMSLRSPSYMQSFTKLLIWFGVIVALRVIFALLDVVCSKYVEEHNEAAIKIVFSVVMAAFIAFNYPVAGIICAIAFVAIGGMIPLSAAMEIEKCKEAYETALSEGNAFIADMAMGADEVIQYGRGADTIENISKLVDNISAEKEDICEHEKNKQMLLALAKSLFSIIIVVLMIFLYSRGKISFEKMLTVIGSGIFAIRES